MPKPIPNSHVFPWFSPCFPMGFSIPGTAALGTLQSFTVFSEPIFLRRGEVHNRAWTSVVFCGDVVESMNVISFD